MMLDTRAAVLAVLTLSCSVCLTAAEPDALQHPGAAVYREYCASCHDEPDVTRAPALAALQEMNAEALTLALTDEVMQQQAKGISRRELRLLVDYLAAKESDSGEWLAGMMCDAERREVDLTKAASLPMVGVDHHSTRHLTAEQAGLGSEDLENLELAWAMAFPDTASLRASPVIVGDTMFYTPTQTGRLLALNVNEPCVKWVYDAGTQLRTSISYGELGEGGRKALVLADRLGRVHTVDPRTGERIWAADGRHSEAAGITGAPVLYGRWIIVPVSSSGVGRGADPNYECCVEHGAVVALHAATGEKLWTYHTMREAEYTGRVSRIGVKQRGPSGAPIWSTPTIDGERGLIYATTGQNTSLPATKTSDAILAIDLETGKLRWSFQALANDVWIIGCRDDPEQSTPNCPSPEESVLKDFDFGGAAVLARRDESGDILLAGQKSGDVWALDPDSGELIWNRRVGQGTTLGGIHWGIAIDGKRVFAPVSDPGFERPGFVPEPGMNAVDIESGEVVWRQPVEADCSEPRKQRYPQCAQRYGLSATPLVVDRSVIAGAVDGRLYIYDAATGRLVFEYDTLRDFDTVNGIEGKGGAIDSHSVFAGAGMVFVGSGYGGFRQAPGNVLLAFRPRRQEAGIAR